MYRLIILFIFTLLPISSVRGSTFPESTQIEGANYPKMGEHRVTYKLFFKLYDAALFTEAGATAGDVLDRSCAFCLEFRYLRSIPKATILKSANHVLAQNLSPRALSRIAHLTDQLHATYRTVQTGDVSTLTYIPGEGTTFAINGEQLITITGEEFAQHYLKIWLGKRPISVELRDQLLSQ